MTRLTHEIATHLEQQFFGPSFTGVSFTDALEGVTQLEATTSFQGCNTIGTLVHHLHYYLRMVIRVLDGHPLEGRDALSFEHPPIHNESEWQRLLERFFTDARRFAKKVRQLEDGDLNLPFDDGKYGSIFHNLQGFLEHNNYHLGQISLLKKLLRS